MKGTVVTIEDLVQLLQAVNSGWAVLALLLVGTFLLIWRYGHELLKLSRESNLKANEANERVIKSQEKLERIHGDLETNHGSENMGEAIDRLTGWTAKLLKAERKSAADRQQLNRRVAELSAGLREVREYLLDYMTDDPEEDEMQYSLLPKEEEGGPCRH